MKSAPQGAAADQEGGDHDDQGIAALAVSLGLLLGPAGANAPDQVSLLLNWYLGGLHAPSTWARSAATSADEGIELVPTKAAAPGGPCR